MKELEVMCGDEISRACSRLATEAPAFMIFNGVRVEAAIGDTAGDLYSRWSAEMDRRRKEYEASPEYKRQCEEATRRRVVEERVQAEARAKIAASGVREKYPWPETMGEVSGFGGGYEQACRDMVYAGLAWLQEAPRDLSSYSTPDAKTLENVLLAAEPGCSGAMHGAAMSTVAFVAKNGWDERVGRVRAADDEAGIGAGRHGTMKCMACRFEAMAGMTPSIAFLAGVSFAFTYNDAAIRERLCPDHATALAHAHEESRTIIFPEDRRRDSSERRGEDPR